MVKAGELPIRRTYLRAYLTEVRAGLIRDLGPTEADLTTGQRVILDRAVSKLSILRCIEEYVKEEGVFRGRELSPVLAKNYVTYAEALRRDLQALGIDKRKADEAIDLGCYLESKAKEQADKGMAPGKGGSENAQPGASVGEESGPGGVEAADTEEAEAQAELDRALSLGLDLDIRMAEAHLAKVRSEGR
jgi:hypothetical protein